MRRLAATLGLVALTLAACAQTPKGSPVAKSPPPAAPLEGTRQAIDLMNQGRIAEARPVLAALLEKDPNDKVARRLMQQLDADPKTLLPGKPKAYTVGPGETLSMLAGRFLGDPLLFYALARYNGFAAPLHVQPGHVIQIPRAPKPAQATAKPKPPAPTARATAPSAPAKDPARAAKLRAAGLDELNRGAPAKALSLLQQALAADPGNAAIERDLARAKRIHASVAR
ncbi:MAG: LysM peptidoglycan-binding domain-containing protein [Phenylobacterium sp.]|jgi:tetratricopeptide (TPR) repeat protein|uniref:LysM peptidoglycan-binding domain-containing protein n=1 Tax=Phenylobacterium sp. TaxID=1871053 RepID=UPI002A3069CC|nr:LysM peptidoglycan-binding domain-containing protein [Phenylobacterium sp.]MDD3836747.1 LysM peptidoglycan-binding domain-containing protein [Phenylobacterium sp.]MDX9998805.1 LysM peptidoglycan-binding domain-containing protein [Phenylobacterium sp.]